MVKLCASSVTYLVKSGDGHKLVVDAELDGVGRRDVNLLVQLEVSLLGAFGQQHLWAVITIKRPAHTHSDAAV